MDTTKRFNSVAPAQLIIGTNSNQLTEYAIEICKKNFCNNLCNNCIICKQIEENRYHNVLLIKSDKQYKLQDIDVIFEKISVSLDESEKFFFIIENADQLNLSCSNRLLKIVEEPPCGYYFIFLTQRPQDILDTIKSRCIKIELNKNFEKQTESIVKYFTTEKIEAPDFLFYIEKTNISEQNTLVFLDEILKFWIKENNSKKIDLLLNCFKNLPGNGGSKLFWKTFFTNFYGI